MKIVVPIGPHIANFDDLDPLRLEQDVELVLVKNGQPIPQDSDVILILGSKATIADMRFFHDSGWSDTIRNHAAKGGHVIGICGGLQMLGQSIADPDGLEGQAANVAGLGLLDIATTMTTAKTLRNVQGFHKHLCQKISGYEIHLGQTIGRDCLNSLIEIDGQKDGAANASGTVWGSYIHGIFNEGGFRQAFLNHLGVVSTGLSQQHIIDDTLNEIAADLEKYVAIDDLLTLAR